LEKVSNISQRQMVRQISKIPGIYEVHIVTGEYDILLKARGISLAEMSNLIIDRIRAINGVRSTLTMAVFETVKEDV